MGPAARLGIFLLLVVTAFLVAALITAVTIMGTGGAKSDLLIWIQGISQLVMFLLPTLAFAWLFEGKASRYFQTGIKKWQLWTVLLSMLLIIIAIPMVDLLSTWNESIHLPESLSQWEAAMRQKQEQSQQMMDGFLARPGFGNMLVNLLVLAFIPAVCEEFVFRGVVQKTLVQWMRNPHVAILIAAAIFSITHFEVFLFVPRFVLGVVLGYIYFYSRTIWASALAHFTNNAIIVVMYYISATNGLGIDPQHLQIPHPVLFGAISLILTTIVVIFIAKIGAKNQKNALD